MALSLNPFEVILLSSGLGTHLQPSSPGPLLQCHLVGTLGEDAFDKTWHKRQSEALLAKCGLSLAPHYGPVGPS